jgi:hypothetical protein
MIMQVRYFSILVLGCLSLVSCSDSSERNLDWSKMTADQKANRLDAQMADRFNYLNNRIDELETKIRNLENSR